MKNFLIAFDFGMKSIGVAVGQRITNTAYPLHALKAKEGRPDWILINRLLKEWRPNEVIIGLPLNMDGTEQPFTAHVCKFANVIRKKFGVLTKLHDERMSTIEVRIRLFEKRIFRMPKKSRIDSISAAIILESYLENDRELSL